VKNSEKLNYLVTGSSGQLGSYLARYLVSQGHKVFGIDISTPTFENQMSNFLQVDFRDVDAIEAGVNETLKNMGKLDCLINLVATRPIGIFQPTENYSFATWSEILQVNLSSIFLVCKSAYSHLTQSKNASIINFSSIYGIRGHKKHLYGPDAYHKLSGQHFNTPVSYSVTKSAIVALTRHLAIEWAASGIRVNAIAPGGIEKDQSEGFVARYNQLTPMGRMGKPSDLAAAVEFLSNKGSEYITGVTLPIDGGWSL
jgi:NAD(P)-dependent dehydrogenase (short-subunit alcohol dehydrogenase family)